jgi:hypothetical protein
LAGHHALQVYSWWCYSQHARKCLSICGR